MLTEFFPWHQAQAAFLHSSLREQAYAHYQLSEDTLNPWRRAARMGALLLAHWRTLGIDDVLLRLAGGELELAAAVRLRQERPAFGIDSVQVQGCTVAVQERTMLRTPFATLVHFARAVPGPKLPRVLVVAPMSGHFATLLRATVRTLLEDHEVFITDWHSARDIPLAAGRFGMDEYARHVVDFLHALGPGAHLLAVCQPCVAALTAVARMSEDRDPCTPISMSLMAGPIDTRIEPTEVNRLAKRQPLEWFARHLITTVPARYAGAARAVYPGFLQLMSFLAMNPVRHAAALGRLLSARTRGDDTAADGIRQFYDEYFATADLPAEFYLETVDQVFQRHTLPRGMLEFEGRRVRPEAIVRTLLLTVEGERDDICAPGQTVAAHDLCSALQPWLRRHHVQAGVGHYGVFSGQRWQNEIYPIVREVVFQAEARIGSRLPARASSA